MVDEQLVVVEGLSVRRKDNAPDKMLFDFEAPVSNGLALSWPFNIESKVKIYPKALTVIAGSKDAGKTAFMINMARMNCGGGFKIHYFMNGEIGRDQMQNRLRNFQDIRTWYNKIDWAVTGNFADVIDRDAINIVDYLEISDNFYLVNLQIKAIQEKLKGGIAIVGLQKKQSTSSEEIYLGRGGEFSRQRASLYLALDNKRGEESSKATIVTGKDWRNDLDNPAYQYVNYQVIQGVKFVNVTEWQGGKLLPKQLLGEPRTLRMEAENDDFAIS